MKDRWYLKYKIAHRGLHNKKYPENSLGAYQHAKEKGFAIELDVRLTKDHEIVCFHDETLQRMCGQNIHIKNLTLNNLRDLRLNNTSYSIPTLLEVLDLIHDEVPIIIEIKPIKNSKKFAELVYNCIKDYKGRIAVKSFNPIYMLWFKNNAPSIIRGMLACNFNNIYLPFYKKFILKRMLFVNKVQPHFISYCYNDLPSKYLPQNIPLITWTIRDRESEEQALKVSRNVIFEGYLPKTIFTH